MGTQPQSCCRRSATRPVLRWVTSTGDSPDSPEEVEEKARALSLMLMVGTGGVLYLIRRAVRWGGFLSVDAAGAGAAVLLNAAGAAYMLRTRRLPVWLKEAVLLGLGLWFLLLDVSNTPCMACAGQSKKTQAYIPLMVLVLEGLLVFDCRVWSQYTVLLVTMLWVLIQTVEGDVWFGVSEWVLGRYDVEWWCDASPCVMRGRHEKVPWHFAETLFSVNVVFALIWWLTRGFVDRMRTAHGRVVAAVDAAESIARALARFDLQAAADAIPEPPPPPAPAGAIGAWPEVGRRGGAWPAAARGRAGADLPPRLYAAFRQLLANLLLYRPYLPAALFNDAASWQQDPAALAPPAEGGALLTSALQQGPAGAAALRCEQPAPALLIRAVQAGQMGTAPGSRTHSDQSPPPHSGASTGPHAASRRSDDSDPLRVALPRLSLSHASRSGEGGRTSPPAPAPGDGAGHGESAVPLCVVGSPQLAAPLPGVAHHLPPMAAAMGASLMSNTQGTQRSATSVDA